MQAKTRVWVNGDMLGRGSGVGVPYGQPGKRFDQDRVASKIVACLATCSATEDATLSWSRCPHEAPGAAAARSWGGR